jgi:hypothetical protein
VSEAPASPFDPRARLEIDLVKRRGCHATADSCPRFNTLGQLQPKRSPDVLRDNGPRFGGTCLDPSGLNQEDVFPNSLQQDD